MNKKIKLSLLGVLFASSALAITMPIVSCSSDTSSTNNLTVTKGDATQLAAIGTAIAAVGKNGTSNNTTALTNQESSAALRANYTGDVKTAIDAYFTFKNGRNDVASANAIESITLTGTYPNLSNVSINARLVIKLKDPYIAPEADLTINVQIGVTYTQLTARLGTPVQRNAIGTELAKIGNPSAGNNTGIITKSQFDAAKTATYTNQLRTAIDAYWTFYNGETLVHDADVIDGIRLLGDYPDSPSSSVEIIVLILFKSPYVSTGNNVLSFQIGVSPAS